MTTQIQSIEDVVIRLSANKKRYRAYGYFIIGILIGVVFELNYAQTKVFSFEVFLSFLFSVLFITAAIMEYIDNSKGKRLLSVFQQFELIGLASIYPEVKAYIITSNKNGSVLTNTDYEGINSWVLGKAYQAGSNLSKQAGEAIKAIN